MLHRRGKWLLVGNTWRIHQNYWINEYIYKSKYKATQIFPGWKNIHPHRKYCWKVILIFCSNCKQTWILCTTIREPKFKKRIQRDYNRLRLIKIRDPQISESITNICHTLFTWRKGKVDLWDWFTLTYGDEYFTPGTYSNVHQNDNSPGLYLLVKCINIKSGDFTSGNQIVETKDPVNYFAASDSIQNYRIYVSFWMQCSSLQLAKVTTSHMKNFMSSSMLTNTYMYKCIQV